jgi:OOP family OmpA-OmpF porin
MRRWSKRLIACAALMLAATPAWALSPYAIFFGIGSARVTQAAEAILDNAVAGMRVLDIRQIDIIGSTDRTGSEGANLVLSRRRAEAVRDALLARGMSRHVRVRIVAAGETQPLVQTDDGVAEPQNRYVMIALAHGCVDWRNGSRATEGECATALPD